MARTGITYEQVASACESLLNDGKALTARAILDITGGSPNNVLKHFQRWREERQKAALESIDQALSMQVKQAILAECAQKVLSVKQHLNDEIAASRQQCEEMQGFLAQRETENEALQTEVNDLKQQRIEQDKKMAISQQRIVDGETRFKEAEKNLLQAERGMERAQTEKSMLEKQVLELKERLLSCEQQYQALQADKHQIDIIVANLSERRGERQG
jgi:chromosome segregation ATPase